MKERSKKAQIFRFDSGTQVEVVWHYGLKMWMATIFKPNIQMEFQEFHATSKRRAVKGLRAKLGEYIALEISLRKAKDEITGTSFSARMGLLPTSTDLINTIRKASQRKGNLV